MNNQNPKIRDIEFLKKEVQKKYPDARAVNLIGRENNWYINLSKDEGIKTIRSYSNEYGAWYAAYFAIIIDNDRYNTNKPSNIGF